MHCRGADINFGATTSCTGRFKSASGFCNTHNAMFSGLPGDREACDSGSASSELRFRVAAEVAYENDLIYRIYRSTHLFISLYLTSLNCMPPLAQTA